MTMDTIEQRSGSGLPWPERPEPDDESPDRPGDAGEGVVADAHVAVTEVPPADPGVPETGLGAPATEVAAIAEPDAPAGSPGAAAGDGAPRQSRFIAELTRAMHAAAEEGRRSALEQCRGDGKRLAEEIVARSADDAAALRHGADEDVARVREWSKAEIVRIREETDRRIGERKSYLDRQLEGHAAVVEREIEHVQEQIVDYEGEMSTFFDQLLAEMDPGRFATLAASLPEPPPFTPVPEKERREIEARALGGPAALEEPVPDAAPDVPTEVPPSAETAPETGGDADTGEAAPTREAATGAGESGASSAEEDARLAALGDLAEAERAARDDVSPDEADLGIHGASLSARLAGLVMPAPAEGGPRPAPDSGPTITTQVVVTGLTSVASIAAFKRQLGRLDGVRAVAVSSGPSEEFVFAVVHAEGRPLADGIASLTGFAPRIDHVDAAEIKVAARDPES